VGFPLPFPQARRVLVSPLSLVSPSAPLRPSKAAIRPWAPTRAWHRGDRLSNSNRSSRSKRRYAHMGGHKLTPLGTQESTAKCEHKACKSLQASHLHYALAPLQGPGLFQRLTAKVISGAQNILDIGPNGNEGRPGGPPPPMGPNYRGNYGVMGT
jgi:hypothetical protein